MKLASLALIGNIDLPLIKVSQSSLAMSKNIKKSNRRATPLKTLLVQNENVTCLCKIEMSPSYN